MGALHVVTAWAGEPGLALGQEVCAEESDEITAPRPSHEPHHEAQEDCGRSEGFLMEVITALASS